MADKKKPFIPPFLAKLGIKSGEWTYHSKLSIKALMRPNFPLKVRIWACLSIQTFGYEGDVGVIMKRQKEVDGSTAPAYEPLTPAEIAKQLKFAAQKAFHEAGMKLTPAQEKELFVQKSSVRRVLADMESGDGLIVRAVTTAGTAVLRGLSLDQAIDRKLVRPLGDLDEAERERLSLGNEEGTNTGAKGGRVCIYLRAIPQKPTAEALAEALPSKGSDMTPYGSPALRLLFAALKRSKLAISAEQLVDLEEVKAALAEYEQVLANVKQAETDLKEFVVSTALRVSLRDGIHPVSAASNPNGKVDSRKCSVLGPPNTLPSNTLTPSGVADSHSTASNPTGKQGLGRPERFQGLNAPANREAVDKHRGAEKPLVSEPRPKAAAPASPSDSFVDKGFADHLIAAFVNGNRPVPTSLQIAQTQQSLPDEQEARLEFVDQLRQKMHKIKGPGVLAGEAQAFTTAWPMMVAKKEAQFAQQQPTEYSPVESLAIEIQFADTLPDHPDSVASRIVIAKAQMENPELYAAAVEFLANSKRMVS